jgi:hypothetical protein
VIRTSIFAFAASVLAIAANDVVAQQPISQTRKPSAFDQPYSGPNSFERQQSLDLSDVDTLQKKARDPVDYRQRLREAEERSRLGVAMLRPNRPAHPLAQNQHRPRRIIYLPYVVD